ncbi:hypothetical protein E8E11_010913 [Didymella keratinophila]|nr:hypothetical protein E8E11_010913 [Didymella keratinophila]
MPTISSGGLKRRDRLPDLLTAPDSRDKDHARMRRSLNHAFSEQALRSQEDIITGYIEHLFDGLIWMNLATTLMRYPIARYIGYVDQKLGKRLSSNTDRNDFIGHMAKHTKGKGFAPEELRLISGILILAGSETSATCLSGAIYFLVQHPEWTSQLLSELRSAFRSSSEMTFQSLAPLKVLNSIIQESLRMYPPLPIDMPRMTTKEGASGAGTYIPPHTRVGIPMYPAFHSETNFKDPDTFAPNAG